MKKHAARWFRWFPVFLILTTFAQADAEPKIIAKEEQHALAVGHAVLKLDELGGAGAALMSSDQESELERNIKFLSETKAGRMTWAWLEFRIRADSQLQLENNPGAAAISQRLDLFSKLLRKYFVLE